MGGTSQVRRMLLVAAVIGLLSTGIAWAEQSNGAPELIQPSTPVVVDPGRPVQLQLQAFDPDDDPLTFAVTAGYLPQGLWLGRSTGVLGGEAQVGTGTYPVTITVTD